MKTPIDIQQLLTIHSGAIDYFDKLHKRGAENERYYSADPFDDKQKKEYALKDRIPFSISSIPQKLNSIISTEQNTRVSWKATPKIEPDDIPQDPNQLQQLFLKEVKGSLATYRLKMIEKQNKALYKFSDIFASGVAIIYGVAKIFTDKNKFGDTQIRISDVDYKNFIWDRNSVEYEHNDGFWQAEKRYDYRIDLARKYGKDKVKDLSIGGAFDKWGRKKIQYFVNYSKDGNSDMDLLTVFEHYHKQLRNYYTVLFNGQIVSCERSKSEAEKTLRMLQMPYLSQGQDIPPSDVMKTPRLMLDKYVFTYTNILEYEETDMEVFPYSIYQAFQFKDKIWTMTDILKSMQQLANRLLAQIDYAFGVDIKEAWTILMSAIDGIMDKDEAEKILREGGLLPVNTLDAVKPVQSKGANAQWIEVMQIMLGLIDEIGGGKTFSGNPNSGQQSGKAINALIGQGQLLTSKFIDNRNRFLEDLGRKVLWFMKKYDTSPYIMRIEAGSLSNEMLQLLQSQGMYSPSLQSKEAGYVKMNENGNYLDTSDYDLEITEESLSDNKKEMEFQLMATMEQYDPDLTLSPTWRESKLEVLPRVSYEKRTKIIKEIEQIKAQQAQQAQQQAQQAQQLQQEALGIKAAETIINDRGNQVGQTNQS